MAKSKVDYQSLSAALDDVLAALQEPDVQIDEAVKLYEQGLKLVAQLEAHLGQAENSIERLRLEHAKPDSAL